jgi:hypothetical protein
MGGRNRRGFPRTPVRNIRDAGSHSSGGNIDVYITTTMIPATREIRHCAGREGTNLRTKKMATVRTDRGIPITAKSMSSRKKLPGSKIGTIFSCMSINV